MSAIVWLTLGAMIGAPLGMLTLAVLLAGSREDRRIAELAEEFDAEDRATRNVADPCDSAVMFV